MKRSKFLCGILMCLTNALSSVGGASVFSAKIRPLQFNPEPMDYSRGLDLSVIQPIYSVRGLKSADVANVIPMDLDPGDQLHVGRRIISNTVSHAMRSDVLRNSSLGRTAQTVQNSMQAGMTVGSREPNSIQHQIRAAVDPVQAQARINYSGLTNAQLSYHANESQVDFEWREKVAVISTDLVYNHVSDPAGRRDLMSLRWSW